MVALGETCIETIYLVMPEHVNTLGILHGGKMMRWLATHGTLAASRVSRGHALLAAVDDVLFVNPVRLGDILHLRARVEWVGWTSLDVAVEAWTESTASPLAPLLRSGATENPRAGVPARLTTSSRMLFVSVDEHVRPRPVGVSLEPGPGEEGVHAAAGRRHRERVEGFRERGNRTRDLSPLAPGALHRLQVSRIVFPEDAIYGNLLFAGSLLPFLDELGGLTALRYSRRPSVTTALDSLAFYTPIRVGEFLHATGALTHVGRTSMEVALKVLREDPRTGEQTHTCTAYFSFVALGQDGRPKELPPYAPGPGERGLWVEAEERRRRRLEKVKRVEEMARNFTPPAA